MTTAGRAEAAYWTADVLLAARPRLSCWGWWTQRGSLVALAAPSFRVSVLQCSRSRARSPVVGVLLPVDLLVGEPAAGDLSQRRSGRQPGGALVLLAIRLGLHGCLLAPPRRARFRSSWPLVVGVRVPPPALGVRKGLQIAGFRAYARRLRMARKAALASAHPTSPSPIRPGVALLASLSLWDGQVGERLARRPLLVASGSAARTNEGGPA